MGQNNGSRRRVLALAEACNPTWTSVPLVGCNLARALAERDDLDVTLVTHVRNRAALEADPLAQRARLAFIDNERLARPLFLLSRLLRGGQSLSWTTATALAWPAYMAFEQQVYARFRRRLETGAFDLIHRLTPVSPTLGSPLASLTDVPMILGPLNGGLPWPKEFPELRAREREWLVPLRQLYRRLPYYRSTYRHAAAVISGSRHTATEVPADFAGQRYYLPENGVDPQRFALSTEWPAPAGRFRFITVGRLVPYKGIDLILDAMSQSHPLRDAELVVVGDGPQRGALTEKAQSLGLHSHVQFRGWLDQARLGQELRQAQAFVFPSLREFGGGGVLEAMAAALPSIVVAPGGPGELIAPDCGRALPLAPRAVLVEQLRLAMEELCADPSRCRALGRRAGERVRDEFTWSAKASRVAAIYDEVLSHPRQRLRCASA